jgi:HEAT repeat protein
MALKQIGRLVGLALLVLGFSIPHAVAADDAKLPNDVPSLIKLLHDKNPEMRGKAANQLGSLREKAAAAIPDLIALLNDEDKAGPILNRPVADVAWLALSNIRKPAIRPLIEATENANEKVRERAILALEYMKPSPPKEMAAALLPRLADPCSKVRSQAVKAIGSLGKDTEKTLPKILALAEKDPDDSVRNRAIEAIGCLGKDGEEALSRILDLAEKDANENVRLSAITVAAKMNADGALTIPMCIRLLRDKSPSIRGRAAQSLGQYGSKAASAVASLSAGLDDQELRHRYLDFESPDRCAVRCDMAEALRRIGPAAAPALPKLNKMLHSDKDPEVRAAVGHAILRINPSDKAALPELIVLLKNDNETDNWTVSAIVLAAFEDNGPSAAAAVPAIKEALHSDADIVRVMAAYALVAVAGKNAVPTLIEQMEWERQLSAKRQAKEEKLPKAQRHYDYAGAPTECDNIAAALGKLGPDAAPAVPILISIVANPENWTTDILCTVESLGLIGPAAKDAVPVLIKEGLDDEDAILRQLTAEALGRIGPAAKDALPQLRQLAEADLDEDVQTAARAAVEKIEAKGPQP